MSESLAVSLEFSEDELRHLRFLLGGPVSFEDISKKWSSQKFLTPLFKKLIAAEKYLNKELEASDGIDRPDDRVGQVVGNNRTTAKV